MDKLCIVVEKMKPLINELLSSNKMVNIKFITTTIHELIAQLVNPLHTDTFYWTQQLFFLFLLILFDSTSHFWCIYTKFKVRISSLRSDIFFGLC